MSETPIADLVEKMLASSAPADLVVLAARALELSRDCPRDSHVTRADKLKRRRDLDRLRKQKQRAKHSISGDGKAAPMSTPCHADSHVTHVDTATLTSLTEFVVKQGIQDRKEQQPELLEGKKPKKVSRGTRLPADWQPSDADIAFATARSMRLFEIDNEATKFRNYWVNRTDKQGAKPRWDLAWQNWILNVRPNGGGKSSAASAPSFREIAEQLGERDESTEPRRDEAEPARDGELEFGFHLRA